MTINLKRLFAGLIDHIITVFIVSIAAQIIFNDGKNGFSFFSILWSGMLIYFVLITCKDLTFRNASVGKRIFKIVVVKEDESKLTVRDLILRNIILLLLLPIEVLRTLFREERFGDMLTKTTVINSSK